MHTVVGIVGIVIVVGLVVTRFIVQTVRTGRAPMGTILSLYREVKHDEGLARKFGYRGKVVPFRTATWLRCKGEVDFLPAELKTVLATTYEELARLNETIAASVEQYQESHLNTVNTGPVREHLTDIRRQLDIWISKNLDNPDYAAKKPRFFW